MPVATKPNSAPPNRVRHPHHLRHLLNIMHPHNIRPSLHRRRHCRRRAPDPLPRLLDARNLPHEPLPARSHQPRQSPQPLIIPQVAQPPQEFNILRLRLRKADARIQHDPPPPHARRLGRSDAREQLAPDRLDDAVRVVGHVRHRFRRAAHVHQHDGFARPRGGGEHVRVEGAGRDVVDDVCAGGDGFGGDAGAVGVDADGDVGAFGHRADEFDGGEDALEFFCFADVRGAGPCGLAADVEDGGAGCDV